MQIFVRLHLMSLNFGDLCGNTYSPVLCSLDQGDAPLRKLFQMSVVSTHALSQPRGKRIWVGLCAAKRLVAPGKGGQFWAQGLQNCSRD